MDPVPQLLLGTAALNYNRYSNFFLVEDFLYKFCHKRSLLEQVFRSLNSISILDFNDCLVLLNFGIHKLTLFSRYISFLGTEHNHFFTESVIRVAIQ